MSDELEYELTVGREEAATALRRVADGVIGGTVRVGDADDGVDVAVPEELELEVEFETEDGERSLEVELEWPVDAEASEGEGDEAETDEEPPAVLDLDASPAGARFEVFRDRADEWRWRLVHRNGNVIATSGEGYTRKHNARKGLQSVIRNAPSADVVESAGADE